MQRFKERIINFNKAFVLFDEMRTGYLANKTKNEFRLGLAQGFEIVTELGWKVLKDYLNSQMIEVSTPKEVIENSFLHNIIPDGQVWIDMIKARNSTSHEYNTDKVNEILEKISTDFYNELVRFKKWLEIIYE